MIAVTDAMVDAYWKWRDDRGRDADTDRLRHELAFVFSLIDPVPDDVSVIRADDILWRRHTFDRQLWVPTLDSGYVTARTIGWIMREKGPVTW